MPQDSCAFASTLDAALRYAARGWLVFPTKPSKHPHTEHGHLDATVDPAQIARWWAQWPDAGIGLDCERSGVAVIDLDYDPTKQKDGPATWSVILQDHGGRDLCGLVATTPRGGRHLFYRMPDPVVSSRIDLASGIDVRARGGYVVLPSPASPGREWRAGDPFDLDTDGIGDIDTMPEWIRDFVGSRRDSMPQGNAAGGASAVEIPIDPATCDAIRSALGFIDPDPRDVWIRVGMALKSTSAREQAYDLWCEWSAQSPKFQPKAQRRQWNSLKELRLDGSEVTLGTLYHLARDGGWAPRMSQEILCEPASPRVEPSDDAPPPSNKRPFPRELADVPGVLGEMVEWMLACSPRRQPALCLASTIACLGALLGRRVQTPTGLRTNIYALGIAETASGKNAGLRLPVRLFALAGLTNWIGASEWKSDSGLRSSLLDEATRSHICLVDEFTKFLQAVSGPNAGGHQVTIKRALLELFSCANSTWLPAAYADRKLNPATPIEEPHLCFYGVGVPSELFSAVDSRALTDGFLNRLLVFVSDDGMPARQRTLAGDPPSYLVEGLRDLERLTRRQGDLSGVCRTVGIDSDAQAALDQIVDANDERVRSMRRSELAPLADLWVRLEEHVAKLALIHATTRIPGGTIGLDAVLWAEQVARWCLERVQAEAEGSLADNATQGAYLRVLRLVRDAGPGGLSLGALTRRTQWLRRSERKDLLASLCESGDAEMLTGPTDGRPRTLIVARSGTD